MQQNDHQLAETVHKSRDDANNGLSTDIDIYCRRWRLQEIDQNTGNSVKRVNTRLIKEPDYYSHSIFLFKTDSKRRTLTFSIFN